MVRRAGGGRRAAGGGRWRGGCKAAARGLVEYPLTMALLTMALLTCCVPGTVAQPPSLRGSWGWGRTAATGSKSAQQGGAGSAGRGGRGGWGEAAHQDGEVRVEAGARSRETAGVRVRVRAHQDGGDIIDGRPLVLQDVQADRAVGVDCGCGAEGAGGEAEVERRRSERRLLGVLCGLAGGDGR